MFPDLTRDDVFRIETRRLWLRWPRARDVEAIVRLAGERAIAEMTARIPHPIDPLGIETFVIESRRAMIEGSALTMALAPRTEPGKLIGLIGIDPDLSATGPHLGYWLGRPYWGRGLMPEAARAMIEAYFSYAGGTELSSAALVENAASRRVLEKCGFARIGTAPRPFPARGGDRLCALYRLTRAAWSGSLGEGIVE